MTNISEVDPLLGALNAFQTPCRQRDVAPPIGRAMLLGHSSLIFECLREAMSVRGIETDVSAFEQCITACASGYDLLVIFLMRCEGGTLTLVKQRMSELRPHMPQVPVVALVEDPGAEAAACCEMGFSTVVLGLPSVPFAVDVVHGLLLGARHVREFDRADRDPHVLREYIEGNECTALTVPDVCFTRRETQLLDLLRRGLQNKLIAYKLGISQSTVKAHLRSIMMKLKAKNRTQAICMLTQDSERAKAV
jgi:DNA-binding NarL/FixJ family response regulator